MRHSYALDVFLLALLIRILCSGGNPKSDSLQFVAALSAILCYTGGNTIIIHSHNTRNKNGYLIPNVRTNCRKFTVSYAGPILWNSFPQKLRQLPSEVLFKRKLKYILLATY